MTMRDTMSTEIHAHKVLELIKQQPMTEPELRAAALRAFGAQAQFRTCKRSGFDLDSLLFFFQQQQKVLVTDGVWYFNPARICQH